MVIDPRTGPNQGERIIAVACSGDPVPGASYGFLRSSLQVREAEEWRRTLDVEEKQK